jgi:hypothetical protein
MDNDVKALVPIDEREVFFYDDALIAVLVTSPGMDQPQIYVPVKPLSDALGLAWSGQYERLQRDEVLSEVAQLIRVTRINSQRGNPDSICLPLEFIPGWLFGITAARVKEELRDKIIRYRRECYAVLSDAFMEGRLTSEPAFNDVLATDTPAVQTYKMLQAMTQLARNQMLMEARLTSRLDNYEQRLESIEAHLGDPGHHITPDQAMQISQAVKTIAFEIEKRTKKNEYGAIYGQLYRQFGITSYKQLPADKFDRAMAWLTEWYQRVTGSTGDDLPF